MIEKIFQDERTQLEKDHDAKIYMLECQIYNQCLYDLQKNANKKYEKLCLMFPDNTKEIGESIEQAFCMEKSRIDQAFLLRAINRSTNIRVLRQKSKTFIN